MKYYVIDWEFKEITNFPTKEKAEEWVHEECKDLKEGTLTVIKGEELKLELPKRAKIIEKK